MLNVRQVVGEVHGVDARALPREILTATEPVVLRGLVADWPLVEAGAVSADAAIRYVRGYYRDATVGVLVGNPEIRGRFFYNDDMTGFNYQRAMMKLDAVLDTVGKLQGVANPPAVYVGSTTIDTCLPGFRQQNDLGFGEFDPLASIWLGNRTRIAAHYDAPDNIACVAVGHRRFILFPPAELANLYVGPLDFNPAGQAISLVNFAQPDFERFPRFADALQNARIAELNPGDAIFIPSMWWHHVEALDDFNVLVNYWWRQTPDYMGAPVNALMHALLSLKDLPVEQRDAWYRLFRHYVFEPGADTLAHIPEQCRGVLAPIDEARARGLRAMLLNRLNR